VSLSAGSEILSNQYLQPLPVKGNSPDDVRYLPSWDFVALSQVVVLLCRSLLVGLTSPRAGLLSNQRPGYC